MSKGVFALIGMLMTVLYGEFLYAQNYQNNTLEASLNLATQKENFTWSIAGNSNGEHPNILSEIKWTSIRSTQIGADFKWTVLKRFVLLGNYTYSTINLGTISDTDFDEDNRTSISYSENFNGDKGKLYDGKMGVGYKLVKIKEVALESYIGYGISSQKYLINSINIEGKKIGEYTAKWVGPFIALQANFGVFKNATFITLISYHQINFRGIGNWTLVEEFEHPISFKQTAKGYALNVTPMLNFQIYRKFSLGIKANYSKYETGSGTDKLFLKSGIIQKTKFNEAKRNAMGYALVFAVKI